MVNSFIKVFARLKREPDKKKLSRYEISQSKNGEHQDIYLFGNVKGNSQVPDNKFRFHKVFDQFCEQSAVFDLVAKPVINSVLEGFNGTIFAYGQTGSGKTYTITGSPKNYNERGIIPRSIQYIFAHNEKIFNKPLIHISYMEIYNEIAYDLLGSKTKTAYSLEQLPRIVLLEDRKGECHIRNLSILPVSTEEEAMRLLFLGDTNRTIAETPMNEYSSRSHCIFTTYFTYTSSSSDKMRFSKLHLVDLAGSERVHKTCTTGLSLNEAKYINLSLHYLQQVILALSEQKRFHVPYRNSIMTNILKDSLSGNCLTVMIANLAITKKNVLETISTCKFAQRVSLLKTEPVINEIGNPQEELVCLRNRIKELEEKLSFCENVKKNQLNPVDLNDCKKLVDKFLIYGEDVFDGYEGKKALGCLNILKCEVNSYKEINEKQREICEKQKTEMQNLKKIIDDKEKEIDKLKSIIQNIPEKPLKFENAVKTPSEYLGKHCCPNFTDVENNRLFEIFLANSGQDEEIKYYRNNLNKKLEIAKLLVQTLEQCQRNIIYIRRKLETNKCWSEKNLLTKELTEQQMIYRKTLEDLKRAKTDTARLEFGLNQSEIQLKAKFTKWLTTLNYQTPSSDCNNCYANDLRGIYQNIYSCQNSASETFRNSPDIHRYSSMESCCSKTNFGHSQSRCNTFSTSDNTSNSCCLFKCNTVDNVRTNSNDSLQIHIEPNIVTQKYPLMSSQPLVLPNQYHCIPCKNYSYYCESEIDNIQKCSSKQVNTTSNDCFGNLGQSTVLQSGVPIDQNIHNFNTTCTRLEGLQTEPTTLSFKEELTNTEGNKERLNTIDLTTKQGTQIKKKFNQNTFDGEKLINEQMRTYRTTKVEGLQTEPTTLTFKEELTNTDGNKERLNTIDLITKEGTQIKKKFNQNTFDGEQLINEQMRTYRTTNTPIEYRQAEENNAYKSEHFDNVSIDKSKPIWQTGDSEEFKEFMGTVQLTGDEEIDQEIVNFYRTKFI